MWDEITYPIPKLPRPHNWSWEWNKLLRSILYNGCNYHPCWYYSLTILVKAALLSKSLTCHDQTWIWTLYKNLILHCYIVFWSLLVERCHKVCVWGGGGEGGGCLWEYIYKLENWIYLNLILVEYTYNLQFCITDTQRGNYIVYGLINHIYIITKRCTTKHQRVSLFHGLYIIYFAHR